MTRSLLAFVTLLACDSKEVTPAAIAAKPADSKAKRDRPEAADEKPEPQWSTVATLPTSVEVDGQKFRV